MAGSAGAPPQRKFREISAVCHGESPLRRNYIANTACYGVERRDHDTLQSFFLLPALWPSRSPLPELERLRRRRRFRAVLRASQIDSLERRANWKSPGLIRPATAASTLQSPRGRRRDVCAGEEQLHRRAGRRHRQRNLDATRPPPTRRSSPIAASTIGRARTAPTGACCSAQQSFSAGASMRAPASRFASFGDERRRRSEGRSGPRSEERSRWCNPPRRAACSRIC